MVRTNATVTRGISTLLIGVLVLAGSLFVVIPAGSARMAYAYSPRPADRQAFPRYNEVYGIATHNSYWINRSDQVDYQASGTQELLSDQLLQDHVRAIELDVHAEGGRLGLNNFSPPASGRWRVYHTSPSEDFSCRYLDECLEMLRNFQYAVPQHEVINVVVELKNVVNTNGLVTWDITTTTYPNFSANHTIEQFDANFRSALGSALYTPRDFLDGCPVGPSLTDCMKNHPWSTVDQLRGKFIINVIGNWSEAATDWAQYATTNIDQRVAFPTQTVFEVDRGCQVHRGDLDSNVTHGGYGLNPASKWFETPAGDCIRDIDDSTNPAQSMATEERGQAFRNSVFWQLEDVASEGGKTLAKGFVDGGGIVRGADSYDFAPGCKKDYLQCQEDRIQARYQLIQTDYPWHFVHNLADPASAIPSDRSQRLMSPGWLTTGQPGPIIREPGSRIYFHTPGQLSETWAYANEPDMSQRWWEATVSTTRLGDTWGTKPQENCPWPPNLSHSGCLLTLDDYKSNCPPPEVHPEDGQTYCTNYPRQTDAEGEGSIRAGSSDGRNWMMISRQKNTTDGASYYQEGVHLYIRFGHDGQTSPEIHLEAARYGTCRDGDDPNSDKVSWVCIGSMIALAVDNQGSGAVVTAYSAGRLNSQGMPDWHKVAQETFDSPMTKQGYSARTYPDAVRNQSDVLLAGTRTGDSVSIPGTLSAVHHISLKDLPGRDVLSGAPATISDLSVPENPPTVSVAAPSPPPGQNGYFNIHDLAAAGGAITVNVSASATSGTVTDIACTDNGTAVTVAAQTGSNPRTATISLSANGSHTVSCTATDSAGNSGNNGGPHTATVNIDSTPPVLTVPANPVTVDATGPGGAFVSSYPTLVSDNDPGDNPSVSCTPPAPHQFAIGDTTVTCQATDQAGNTSPAQQIIVHVTGASEQLDNLATAVRGVGTGNSLSAKVVNASQKLSRGQTGAACAELSAFINQVTAQTGKKIPTNQANQLIADAQRIRAVIGCQNSGQADDQVRDAHPGHQRWPRSPPPPARTLPHHR